MTMDWGTRKNIGRLIVAGSMVYCGLMMSPAGAQETEEPAPWIRLSGKNAGAVGSCSVDQATDNKACYMVRCDAKNGLVFEIEDDMIEEMGLQTARFEIGKYTETIKLDKRSPSRRTIVLSKHPKFLAALTSGVDFATMFSIKAKKIDYSTGFELTDAREQIPPVAKECAARKP
ncbi:hypothetical protein [Oryzifoliimicrobium ureilyticus]|uniref:hypothetical protein n=1 Tax=Oryzifoliimicrobium ureilyticus TaxID=3113724 RepID=UPI0030761868